MDWSKTCQLFLSSYSHNDLCLFDEPFSLFVIIRADISCKYDNYLSYVFVNLYEYLISHRFYYRCLS